MAEQPVAERPVGERTVRVAAVQQSGLSDDLDANLESVLASIETAAAAGAQLVVPTELCLTPYFAATQQSWRHWAAAVDGSEVSAFRQAARTHGLTVVAPLYLSTEAGPAVGPADNGAVVIGPDGEFVEGDAEGERVGLYRKVHLPQAQPPGSGIDEPRHFAPGRHLPVFDTPRARIGVLICYDRRFGEAWRTLALRGAEVIAVPSCIPLWTLGDSMDTRTMFVGEMRVRAAENLLFAVGVCRAGEERFGDTTTTFIGRSCIVSPTGALLSEAGEDDDEIIVCDLDLAEIDRVRAVLPILDDRRTEAYALGAAPAARSRP